MTERDRIERAVAAGLAALAENDSSELLVGFSSSVVRLEEEERTARIESPFSSAFVLSALSGRLTRRAEATGAIAAPHVRRLIDMAEPSGLWRFSRQWSWSVPPDADDSACALVALRLWRAEFDSRATLDRLLANRDAARRLRTWFFDPGAPGRRELEDEVDLVVNTNILSAAALMGRELPEDAAFVAAGVLRDGLETGTSNSYYPNSLVFAYFLARWLRLAEGFAQLRGFVAAFCRERACTPAVASSLDAALLITCLLGLEPDPGARAGLKREVISPLTARILDEQRAGGLWPAIAVCGDPRGKVYGSAPMTTAACLEALSELAEDRL